MHLKCVFNSCISQNSIHFGGTSGTKASNIYLVCLYCPLLSDQTSAHALTDSVFHDRCFLTLISRPNSKSSIMESSSLVAEQGLSRPASIGAGNSLTNTQRKPQMSTAIEWTLDRYLNLRWYICLSSICIVKTQGHNVWLSVSRPTSGSPVCIGAICLNFFLWRETNRTHLWDLWEISHKA